MWCGGHHCEEGFGSGDWVCKRIIERDNSPVFPTQFSWILGKSQGNIPTECPGSLFPTKSGWHCCCLRPRAGMVVPYHMGTLMSSFQKERGHCKGACVRNFTAVQKGIHKSFLTKQVLLSSGIM